LLKGCANVNLKDGSTYKKFNLVNDADLQWLPDHGEARPKRFSFDNMVVRFYFPHKNRIYSVRLCHTIMLNHPSQQVNVIAYATRILAKDINYECVNIPKRFKAAAKMVGSILSQQELNQINQNLDERIEGPIYPDPRFHGILIHPKATIMATRERKALYFPSCGTYQLGFDCLPKTLNAVLRCGFFTRREQVVRLIQKMGWMTLEKAQK
jgi:hypothetical protein